MVTINAHLFNSNFLVANSNSSFYSRWSLSHSVTESLTHSRHTSKVETEDWEAPLGQKDCQRMKGLLHTYYGGQSTKDLKDHLKTTHSQLFSDLVCILVNPC